MDEVKRIIALCVGVAVGLPVLALLGMFVWTISPYMHLVLFLVGLIALTGVALYGYHWHQDKSAARSRVLVELRRETVKLDLMEDQRALLQAATMRGFNVKVTEEATEIINPISIMPVAHQKMLEAGNAQQNDTMLPALPAPCDFADILQAWRPSFNEILLALAPGGQRSVIDVKSSCHVALCGATGNGKSVILRLLLSQLLYVGAHVILVDPHFAAVDPESGEDWRPIVNRLYMPPVVEYSDILDILSWLANTELPNRLEKRRNGQAPGRALFMALDELPAIVASVPDAPDHLAKILREGRKVGLFLITAAQDFLVKTIGGSGGVRDCFRTAFYVGGDATSARVLLDVKGNVDDGGLGKGVVMLRSKATPLATKVRVPYVSNDALYELLPIETSTSIPTANITAFPRQTSLPNLSYPSTNGALAVEEMSTDGDIVALPSSPALLDARSLRVRELVKKGEASSKIIEAVWGVSSKTGGTAYKNAARELSEILAKLV